MTVTPVTIDFIKDAKRYAIDTVREWLRGSHELAEGTGKSYGIAGFRELVNIVPWLHENLQRKCHPPGCESRGTDEVKDGGAGLRILDKYEIMGESRWRLGALLEWPPCALKGSEGHSTEEASRQVELEPTGVITMTTTESEAWKHGSAKHQYAHGEAGAINRAMGAWFEGMASWQWFVTRTYDPGKLGQGFTEAGAGTAKVMLQDLLQQTVAKRFVAVFERQSRGDYHLHALLAGCRALNGSAEAERDKAKFGIARWKIFNGSGAGGYLAKYLAKDMVDLYIGLEGPYRTLEGTKA